MNILYTFLKKGKKGTKGKRGKRKSRWCCAAGAACEPLKHWHHLRPEVGRGASRMILSGIRGFSRIIFLKVFEDNIKKLGVFLTSDVFYILSVTFTPTWWWCFEFGGFLAPFWRRMCFTSLGHPSPTTRAKFPCQVPMPKFPCQSSHAKVPIFKSPHPMILSLSVQRNALYYARNSATLGIYVSVR